jgi:hypothetical protein
LVYRLGKESIENHNAQQIVDTVVGKQVHKNALVISPLSGYQF